MPKLGLHLRPARPPPRALSIGCWRWCSRHRSVRVLETRCPIPCRQRPVWPVLWLLRRSFGNCSLNAPRMKARDESGPCENRRRDYRPDCYTGIQAVAISVGLHHKVWGGMARISDACARQAHQQATANVFHCPKGNLYAPESSSTLSGSNGKSSRHSCSETLFFSPKTNFIWE